ncbi:hypothetical protein ACO0SA_003014 [Hanseniaspora valbyensis]
MNSAFGQPTFGSNAGNPFASGTTNSNTSSPFGAPSFGNANNTASLNTQNNNNQQQQQQQQQQSSTSAFGQPSFGSANTQSTASSVFGQPSFAQPTFGQTTFGSSNTNNNNTNNAQPQQQAGSSVFGQPSFGQPTFGKPSFGNNATFNAQSPFGQNTNPSPFGSVATNTSSETKPSPFGQTSSTSAFGSTTKQNHHHLVKTQIHHHLAKPTASPFGQTTNASPFGSLATTKPSETKPSPFGQTTTASPFGQTTNASPFGSLATTKPSETKPSPFGQTTTASPFGQTTTASPFGSAATTKPSLFGSSSATTSSETKPSIFGQKSTTESDKPTSNLQFLSLNNDKSSSTADDTKQPELANKDTKKPSLFDFGKTEEGKIITLAKTGIKSEILRNPSQKQSETSKTTPPQTTTTTTEADKTAISAFGSMSINKDSTTPKKTTTSPIKSVPPTTRGLSGATPTKKASNPLPFSTDSQAKNEDLSNEVDDKKIASKLKISKPSEPVKPVLQLESLNLLKNSNKKIMSVVPPAIENVFKNDGFKAMNADINNGVFANNTVSNLDAIKDEYSSVFLQEKIGQFHLGGSNILSYTHRNGTNLIVKQNEIMKISSVSAKKNSIVKNTRFEPFTDDLNSWNLEYNGEDLVVFYRCDDGTRIFVLDIATGKVITINTNFDNGIKKLRWHPLANNSVVILMTENDHNLYQLAIWSSKLLQINEQILGLSNGKNEKDDKLTNIFSKLKIDHSFQFKNVTNFEISANGWKLYLLDTVLNDVYLINPFLPFTGTIKTSEENLIKMKEIHEILAEEEQEKKDSSIVDIIENGLSFLNDDKWFYRKSDNMFYLDVVTELRLDMGLQGPIPFNRFPVGLYDKNMKDIKIIHSSDTDLDLIIILFDTGEIITLIESNKEVLFWNRWDISILENEKINKLILLEDKSGSNLKFTRFTDDSLEDGLVGFDSFGKKIVLSFIDYICKLESFFVTGNSSILKQNFEITEILKLNNTNDYIILINEQLIGQVVSGNLQINTAIVDLSDKKIINEKPVIIHNSLSHDSLNFFKNQLETVSKSIRDLKLLPNVTNSVMATELQNLLENFPDETMHIASDLAISIEKKLTSIKLLQELLLKTINSQEQDFQLRVSQLIDIKPKFYNLQKRIEPNNERYDKLLENWGQKLIKLQNIKNKLKTLEEEEAKNKSRENNKMNPLYYLQIDAEIEKTEKMMKAFEKAKSTQVFLQHKLLSTTINSTEQDSTTKPNPSKEIDNEKLLKNSSDILSAIMN